VSIFLVLAVVSTAEELLGVLQAPAPRLRKEEEHEQPAGSSDAGIQVEAPGQGDGLVERDEGHGDGAAHDPVHCRAERAALRAESQREDLRAVHPRDGAHADGEGRNEREHRRDAHARQRRRMALGEPVDGVQRRGQRHQGHHHPARAREQQRPPPDTVEEERGHQDEQRLGRTHRHGGAQGVIVRPEPGLLEHSRAVQHHGVDAGGLLEALEAETGDQYAAHGRRRADEEVPPHPFAMAALLAPASDYHHVVVVGGGIVTDAVRDADGLLDVGEPLLGLGGGVGGLGKHAARVADAALHDEPPRRLRHGEDPRGEEERRDGADEEHDAPAEVHGEAVEGVVGHVPEEHPRVDEHLREGREQAARRRGRDLGRVHGRDHERVPDADARHAAAQHEDPVARGEAHDERARQEDGRRQNHGVPPADPVGRPARRERADERGDADDAGEDLDLCVTDLEVLLDE